MDSRGVIRLTGWVKDTIIRSGENHFPAEIESLPLQLPAIAKVAVVGLPNQRCGEIISCFACPDGDRGLDVQEPRCHCREHLSPQLTPALWCRSKPSP